MLETVVKPNIENYKDLIFGSTAIKYWFSDFKREPKDLDIITYVDENMFNKNGYYQECSKRVEKFYNPGMEYIFKNNKDSKYVDPDFLYTIKVSHSFWDIQFEKTTIDIMFLKSKGCILNKELFNLLYQDWINIHGKKFVNMNKSCDEFFTNRITRKYNHDYLHNIIKFHDTPYHELIRPNLDNAWCSEELFNKLTHNQKIECSLEEIYVIATERWYLNNIPMKIAIIRSIKTICTTTTKGWFPLFIIENLKEILDYNLLQLMTKVSILERNSM